MQWGHSGGGAVGGAQLVVVEMEVAKGGSRQKVDTRVNGGKGWRRVLDVLVDFVSAS